MDQWLYKRKLLTDEEKHKIAEIARIEGLSMGIDFRNDLYIEELIMEWRDNDIVQDVFDPENDCDRRSVQKCNLEALKGAISKVIYELGKYPLEPDDDFDEDDVNELKKTQVVLDSLLGQANFYEYQYFFESG
jgi:hypothetical protein